MTLFVKGDLGGHKSSDTIRQLVQHQAITVVGPNLYRDLNAELGSDDKAARFLLELATEIQKPIGVHLLGSGGQSYTSFIAPESWSGDKLKGYVARHAQELERAFGKIDFLKTTDNQQSGQS